MAKKFLTDINIAGGVYDSSGDIGSSGQVLSSTGSGINWINANSAASVVYQDGFTGNGSATAFTLANSIDNENKTQVYIDGVYQHKDNYSLSGTTLTFSTAPPNSSDIEVISFSTVSSADDILYDTDFASAGLMTTNGSGVYSITTNNSSNWNTAYTYSQVGHLPLAGGTLTGGLTGTTANFTGIVETNKIFVAKGQNISHTPSSIKISQENTTKSQIRFYGADTSTAGILEFVGSTSNGSAGGTRVTMNADGTTKFHANILVDVINNSANSANIIYRSGTSTLVGGGTTANKLYVLDNGNIGIGTTSPSSKLHVTGAPANGVYLSYLYNSGTHNSSHGLNVQTAANNIATYGLRVNTGGDSNALAVMGNGNVGIGTNSPNEKLQLAGNLNAYAPSGIDAGLFASTASGTTTIAVRSNGITHFNGGNVGIGTTSPGQKLDVVGKMKISDDIILAQTNGRLDYDNGNSNGALRFHSTSGNTERMRITSAGNVGIGTVSPSQVLDVNGNIKVRGVSATKEGMIHNSGSYFSLVSTGDTSDTTGARIWLGNNASANAYYQNASTHYFRDLSSSIKMTLLSSGNLGIGVSSPASKLDINGGRIGIRNNIVAASNLTYSTIYSTENTGSAYPFTGTSGNLVVEPRNGQDFVVLGTSGVARMVVKGGGNVGIGTTSPSVALDVTGEISSSDDINAGGKLVCANVGSDKKIAFRRTGANNFSIEHDSSSLYFYNESTTELPIRFFNNGNVSMIAGNVGIGTSSPGAQLHLYNAGAGGTPMLQVMSHATAAGSFTGNYMAEFCHAFSGVNHAMLIKNNETDGGRRTLDVADGNGIFATFTNGKLGIGTTSPDVKLDIGGMADPTLRIKSDAGGDPVLRFDAVGANRSARIKFYDNGSAVGGFIDYLHNGDIMNFGAGSSTGVTMTVGDQVVGIGTTSPASKFEVYGGSSGVNDVDRYARFKASNGEKRFDFHIGGTGNAARQDMYKNDGTTKSISINAAGNSYFNGGDVGIGTTSPAAGSQLTLRSSASTGMTILSASNTGECFINFSDNDDANVGQIFYGHSPDRMAFRVGDDTRMTILGSSGNVGIGATSPQARLEVNGALIVGPANRDSGVTLSEVGNDVSLGNEGGSIEVNVPIQGTTTNGCTLTFTYAKASWASWILDYEFASTDGMVKGVVGGYNNGSTGNGKTQMLANFSTSVAVSNGGAGNQHVIVTFTFSSGMGIHPFARFKYSQGGGDGTPRADRVSVVYTEGS